MEIKIIGEHLSVTEAISEYIKEKFQHLSWPYKMNYVEFRLGTMKESQYVHFHARCLKEEIVLKANNRNLYQAIDQIMTKIQRSFVKNKEKTGVHLLKTM